MRRASVPAALLFALSLAALAGSGDGPQPLTNEDVVRMVLSGEATETVLEAIRSRPADYRLTDAMVDELSRAGVPDAVLRAMRKRQDEQDRRLARERRETEAAEAGDDGPANLRIDLALEDGRFVFPDHVDERRAAELGLGASPEERAVADLAVFLACLTPDHVPDHWRSASPLGRDFVSTPRHAMLDFHAGSLALTVPPGLAARVAPGVAHDLSVGVAALVAGRWYRIGSDETTVVLGEESRTIAATLRVPTAGDPTIVRLAETGAD